MGFSSMPVTDRIGDELGTIVNSRYAAALCTAEQESAKPAGRVDVRTGVCSSVDVCRIHQPPSLLVFELKSNVNQRLIPVAANTA